ncbi:DUF5682 family protein [Blastopirellula marina]|uniref:Uncharacterized protein n=1 Tax=Blastopirellula marina TaxID=124 RepID=A0A2S8F887_9BACT|nr:DUF5682 family protein [Blastopirellula marina]PQO28355.1 hypothetical protein C5Y98_26035 [Blastopirellula marina]PTL41895.1 hypothetical protein C5Y97_26050 [Blastopirellula marina]
MPDPNTVSLAGIHVFGVRHLSPGGAWHLRQFLDQVRPRLVLIEGLADADGLIPDVTRKDTQPPIAILAYTSTLPVRTLVYPFARYSPEYQALVWAKENKAQASFIDLPSDVFLALPDTREIPPPEPPTPEEEDEPEEDAEDPAAENPEDEIISADMLADAEIPVSVYQRYANEAGEPDYETYWERRFEHNTSPDAYRHAVFQFGLGVRELAVETQLSFAENLVREAYMRRRIQEAIAAGCPADRIVVIVGAYHAPVLTDDHPAMTDQELASLPRRESQLTLMPYSYFRLSSQSGYGAGNHAPAYFELLWDALAENQLPGLPAHYLSLVARDLREQGTHRSTAEVIEGVRLARTLSAMKDGLAPTLHDLRDSAVTLIGHGQPSVVDEALARVDVGTSIGKLPRGVSKTSIQDDFDRELERLKLTKYRSTVKQDLVLDLRENRRVKTQEAAFLDLNRSYFLHRLRVLDIGFALPARSQQLSTTWGENWQVQWSPECEIRLVEAVLLGETVELATAYRFKTRLDQCQSVDTAAENVRDACTCGMLDAMEQARQRLQHLAASTTDFASIAHAAYQLMQVVRYGDVRQFDASPLIPLIETLFVQAALALPGASHCDNETARSLVTAMNDLEQVALEFHQQIDEPLWIDKLHELSNADDRNPLLSGYACSILLERSLIENTDLAKEVSRRLSPGIAADLGAGWFEGLAQRNRYALLARQSLWEQLAEYVTSLEEDEFRRALVFLRRAFGGFSPAEKRHISENLGQHWGFEDDAISELIEAPLSEEEEATLEDLNDFDFDDL